MGGSVGDDEGGKGEGAIRSTKRPPRAFGSSSVGVKCSGSRPQVFALYLIADGVSSAYMLESRRPVENSRL